MPFTDINPHGSYTQEYESSIKGIVTAQNPVFIVGTAPVNMAADLSAVNKLVVIQSLSDVVTNFGATKRIPGFTLTEALFVGLQLFGVKPIVCVNVLNPEDHSTTGQTQDLAVVNKKVTVSQVGILTSTVVVKKSTDSSLVAATDYTLEFDADGQLIVKFTAATFPPAVDVEYSYLDPSLVTEDDIIGTVDPITNHKTGLQCVDNLFDEWSMIPSYGIVPGFYSDNLRAILDTKLSLINNKWQSYNTFYDIPHTVKYGEVIQFKKDHNWIDPDQYLLFGAAKYNGEYWNQSVFAAFLAASINIQNGGWPHQSPSNNNIKATGIAYYDAAQQKYVDLALSEEEANLLNANGIATIIKRPNGTVLWGNRTSVYQPGGNTDPKDTLLCYKSVMKQCANDWILNTSNDVDKPMTPAKAKSIQANYQNYLDDKYAQGKLLGGRIEFLLEENSAQRMIDGKFRWHSYLGAVPPGEALENGFELDAGYLESFWE